MPEPEIGNKEEKLNILRLREIWNQQARGDIIWKNYEGQELRFGTRFGVRYYDYYYIQESSYAHQLLRVMALLLPLTWWLAFPSPSSLRSSSVDLLHWCMFEWLPQRYAHSSRKSKRKFLPWAQCLDCTQSTGGNPSCWQRTSAGSLWVAILSLYKVHNMSHNYLKPMMTLLYINVSASWIC